MLKRLICWITLLCTAPWAQAQVSDWNRVFDVMWEARWQQSGILQSVVRWPTDKRELRYSINESASASNAQRAVDALKAVAQLSGFDVLQVPAGSDGVHIVFDIRHFKSEELTQSRCYMQPTSKNGLYTQVRVVLSEQHAYNCVLHELMHAFGFPGHPQGNTVLSYFEGNRLSLKPIDEFMLKAWHSDATRPGMSPLLAARNLNRLWIQQNVSAEDQAPALVAEQRWFDQVLASLNDFAYGKGEPPTILFRSGRLSTQGLKVGLFNVQGILGFAYLNGTAVPQDAAKGGQLLMMAADNGNTNAAGILARALGSGLLTGEAAATACKWLADSAVAKSQTTETDRTRAADSDGCKAATAKS